MCARVDLHILLLKRNSKGGIIKIKNDGYNLKSEEEWEYSQEFNPDVSELSICEIEYDVKFEKLSDILDNMESKMRRYLTFILVIIRKFWFMRGNICYV